MILFSAIAPKGLDWICRSRGPRALPPKNEGELRAIVIPPTDILVNTVELVNIAPTAKLFKSMTFVMHLSIGELEGNNEGESDSTGFVAGEVVGVPVASGLLALGVDVVGKLFGLADGLALGEVVCSAVSPQSLNDILPMVICCVK